MCSLLSWPKLFLLSFIIFLQLLLFKKSFFLQWQNMFLLQKLSPPQCVASTPRISQSCVLRGWGGPWGQALQQMSVNISPHCSQTFKWAWCCLTERVLTSLLWRHSGMVLWCWNDHFMLKISLQLTLLPEQALLVGSQICTSLRSMLTLSLHYFSTGGKLMQRRPK